MQPARLLERIRRGDVANVDFADAQRLLEALGFEELRATGSHHVYGRPGIAQQLNLQERRGDAKPYQLRQLATMIRRYNLSLEVQR
ncbi:MAG: type II toxin-antitoxin system HicA family toxin [Acidimicrobiales bacterium]